MRRGLIPTLALALLPTACAQDDPTVPYEAQMAEVEVQGKPAAGSVYAVVKARGQNPGWSWEDAYAAAPTVRYRGMTGAHLATITSVGEQATIFGLVNRYDPGAWCWIGLKQTASAASPTAGWSWVTGETISYTAWYTGAPSTQPNDADGVENNAENVAFINGGNGNWYDWPGAQLAACFVIEFDPPM